MIRLDERAKELSTYVIVVSFTDEEGDPVVPNTITWSLIDRIGNIINERDEEEILTPAAEVSIVLSGDDLQILAGEELKSAVVRRLVVQAEYDSTLGDDMPIKEVAQFTITNFPLVEWAAPLAE